MSRTGTRPPKTVRCGIYTRKSTEEGLDQEFNSLDAQRESAEAYIVSQRHEGWVCLPDRYDDGGFTGGNLERPALQRLLADISAGKIDCVIVYKVDRLSRSLLDFTRIMETFDKNGTSFVSVTQQFNTTSSMGRLTLNILLSFAQFEREIISERTRDKMAAARRKGKYVGGAPLLGYDIDRAATRLVVNEREAAQVRQIFDLYLEHESLLPTVVELNRRGWTTKRWTTRAGKQRGGLPFDKNRLHLLLTNATYAGQIRYKDEVYAGEHAAIIDRDTFKRVQRLLRRNARTGGARVRNKYGDLLRGLIHCVPCGCGMTPAHSTKDGKKRYRYYVCVQAQKRGWSSCPSKSVPAAEIEQFVVDQIRAIGEDPGLVTETLAQARKQTDEALADLDLEQRGLRSDLARAGNELRVILADVDRPQDTERTARLAELQDRISLAEQRLSEIAAERERLADDRITEDEVHAALRDFDALWEALTPRERTRVLELLVERVDYDGSEGTIAVTFRPTGIKGLTEEFELEETAA